MNNYPAPLLTSELTVPIQSVGFRLFCFHSRLGPGSPRGIGPRHAPKTPRLFQNSIDTLINEHEQDGGLQNMYNGLQLSDGKRTILLTLLAYDTKYREHRKKGPTWRRFNSVKCFCVCDGPSGKEIFKNHISTYDIERLCVAANAVLSGKQNRVKVTNKKRDLRLGMKKKLDRYSMSIEILTDRGMISVLDDNMDHCVFADKCAKLSGWKEDYPVLSDQKLKQVHNTRPRRNAWEDELELIDVIIDMPELPDPLDDLLNGLDDDFNDFDLD